MRHKTRISKHAGVPCSFFTTKTLLKTNQPEGFLHSPWCFTEAKLKHNLCLVNRGHKVLTQGKQIEASPSTFARDLLVMIFISVEIFSFLALGGTKRSSKNN